MKALIFNSGIGKRLGEWTKKHPKTLIKLNNDESIMHRQLRILSECGIKDFIITTGPFEEQIINETKEFKNLNFTFVHSDKYESTNYIYSMYLTKDLLNDDIIMLHGDLVFNKEIVKEILSNKYKSLCLFNSELELPEKDFKARIKEGLLKEVSINIFDEDCYAFQPLYKLSYDDIQKWLNKVIEFVNEGNVNVYAENALNEIIDYLNIHALDYKNHFIYEIDNLDDLQTVSKGIEEYEKNESNR